MEALEKILVDGGILSVVAALWLTLVMLVSPRIMLQDYPPAIKASVPGKSEREIQLSYILGIPFILILLGGPLLSTLAIKDQTNLWGFWLNAAGVAFVFNVFDWLVLDWLVFCTLTPPIMVIPGTKGMAAYKDYRFHFIGFLKGTVFSVVSGLLIAGLVSGLSVLF
jgi:hypothetical protein